MSKKKNHPSIDQVLTQMVLDIFEQNGNTPLNYKQVAAKLNVRDPDARDCYFRYPEKRNRKRRFKRTFSGQVPVTGTENIYRRRG